METCAVEMRHISKEFSGVKTSRDITLRVNYREIHALLGDNGSGKTALLSILSGMIIPDEGAIFKKKQRLYFHHPNDALNVGIGMIDQDLSLIDSFTALENIVIGVEPTKYLHKMTIDSVRTDVEKINDKYKLGIDLNKKASLMSLQMRQRTLIAKLLYRHVDIFLFDEPFSYLNPEEAENFKLLLLNLANDGCAIVISTKKIREIRDIADRCTILKDGMCLGTAILKDASDCEIEKLMYGREALPCLKRSTPKIGQVALSIRNLSIVDSETSKMIVDKASLDIYAGEITCILGMKDSGNIEFLHGVGGVVAPSEGHVLLRNVDLGKIYSKYRSSGHKKYIGSVDITDMALERRKLFGLAQVPDDGRNYGVISGFNVQENMILQRFKEPRFSYGGFLHSAEIKNYSNYLTDKFEISSYADEPASNLSELSKQKLMLARAIDYASRILIAVRPTGVLDYQSSMEIRQQLIKKRDDAGIAILLASDDVDEAINFADRILVMYKGRLVADLRAEKAEEEKLKMYMAGLIQMSNMKLYDPIMVAKKVRVYPRKIKTKSNSASDVITRGNCDYYLRRIIHKKIIYRHRATDKIESSAKSDRIKKSSASDIVRGKKRAKIHPIHVKGDSNQEKVG